MEKLPNANYIIRDFFKDKENLSVLNKALKNNFWEALSPEKKNVVVDFSEAEKDDFPYLKLSVPRSKMWLLARARLATGSEDLLAYELKFQLNSEDVAQSIGLFDDPIFTKYAVVVVGSEVRMAQSTNSVSFDPMPYLERLKAEVAKS